MEKPGFDNSVNVLMNNIMIKYHMFYFSPFAMSMATTTYFSTTLVKTNNGLLKILTVEIGKGSTLLFFYLFLILVILFLNDSSNIKGYTRVSMIFSDLFISENSNTEKCILTMSLKSAACCENFHILFSSDCKLGLQIISSRQLKCTEDILVESFEVSTFVLS